MYDGPNDRWLVRQTGIMVDVPEIWGHIFVGRTKEGFSLNKVMVGYAGWTMERSTINDATIPILADGIKWLGYAPEDRLLWNLGVFGDWLSEEQTFSTYDNQRSAAWPGCRWSRAPAESCCTSASTRGMACPMKASCGSARGPEASPAPYFVDTPQFPRTAR